MSDESRNGIYRDRTGRPLKLGQIVEGQKDRAPPLFCYGKLLAFTKIKKGEKEVSASVIQYEKGWEIIENKKITIRVDVRTDV